MSVPASVALLRVMLPLTRAGRWRCRGLARVAEIHEDPVVGGQRDVAAVPEAGRPGRQGADGVAGEVIAGVDGPAAAVDGAGRADAADGPSVGGEDERVGEDAVDLEPPAPALVMVVPLPTEVAAKASVGARLGFKRLAGFPSTLMVLATGYRPDPTRRWGCRSTCRRRRAVTPPARFNSRAVGVVIGPADGVDGQLRARIDQDAGPADADDAHVGDRALVPLTVNCCVVFASVPWKRTV